MVWSREVGIGRRSQTPIDTFLKSQMGDECFSADKTQKLFGIKGKCCGSLNLRELTTTIAALTTKTNDLRQLLLWLFIKNALRQLAFFSSVLDKTTQTSCSNEIGLFSIWMGFS